MTDWDILIRNAIAQCQFIFMDDFGDRRLPCEIDSEILKCHGIDEIQLCAYCFATDENLLGKLQWKFEKKEDVYYLFPVAGKEFKNALREIKDTYPECSVRNNYLKKGNLTAVYKICEGKKVADVKSCSLIVDMIFNMNRRERSKSELDDFIALFCCIHIIILRDFLVKAEEYMQNLDANEKRIFLNEIVKVMNKVLSIRKYITGKDKQVTVCKDLRKSSAKIIGLKYDEGKAIAIRDNFAQEFERKMRETFSPSAEWRYNKNIRGKNCRDIFRSLVKMCFEEAKFDIVKGVGVIEIGLSDVNVAKNLLNSDEK